MAMAKRFKRNENNNAICYYRYSSDAQREVSIKQQAEAAHNYAQEKGYHIIREYQDSAMSGTRDDRPDFQRMLREVEELKPAYLILWKTDRLSRDRIDAAIAKNRLRQCGCQIEYVAEPMPEDEAERVLIEGISEALAEHFVIQHTKNVTRGMKYNAENALYNGRKVFGYIGKPNCKYETDPQTAPIVKRIFQKYADGVPLQSICNELNDAGIKSSLGNSFTINSLRHILHNRMYVGEYKWGDILVPDGVPRLIDDALFEKVEKRFKQNKRGGQGAAKKLHNTTNVDFWLTNHMYCGKCGATVSGMSGTSKTGKTHYYYTCTAHRKHKCSQKSIRKEQIESIVKYALEETLNNPHIQFLIATKCYNYYKSQVSDNGEYEKSIQSRIKEVDKSLANIMKAIEAGIFNDTTQARMKELEIQKSLLADELVVEQNRRKYEIKFETIVKYLQSFAGDLDDPKQLEKVLAFLVKKIYTYGDSVMIMFSFIDDKRYPYKDTLEHIEILDNVQNILNSRTPIEEEETPERREAQERMLKSLTDDSNEDFNFFG